MCKSSKVAMYSLYLLGLWIAIATAAPTTSLQSLSTRHSNDTTTNRTLHDAAQAGTTRSDLANASSSPPPRNESTAQEQPGIKTTSGTVLGHKSTWPEGADVDEYLGIPFAAAPVGKLRFMAPERYRAEPGRVVRGDKYMDACLQPVQGGDALLPKLGPVFGDFGYALGAIPGRAYSEDCLGLNIWRKGGGNQVVDGAMSNSSKAVMIWVHGGAFTTGDPASSFYNGARLAAQEDVIVVTVGYRLGFWSNPGAPGLSEHNLGLRDVRMAVEWLRDNIDKFGGDPKRMTLFGESSGGVFVDYYAYAYPHDPIIAGTIAQSGNALIGIGYPRVNPLWFSISNSLGCGGLEQGNHTRMLECMQGIPANLILSAGFGATPTGVAMQFGAFGPIVDNELVFGNYRARASSRMFAQISMVVGHTEREAGLLAALPLAALKGYGQTTAKNGGSQVLSTLLGALSSTLDTLRYSYITRLLGSFVGPLLEGAVGCAARDAAQIRIDSGNIPVWRYLFAGSYAGSELYPDTGAYHVIDVPAVFGTNEHSPAAHRNSVDEDEFVRSVMGAWAAFARDPVGGLDGVGWRRYDRTTQSLNKLKHVGKSTNVVHVSNAEYDGFCPVVERIGTLTGISSGA